MRRRALAAALGAAALAVAVASPAAAHPLGNFTVSRFSGLEVATDAVTVHYAVDMAEIPTFQERDELDGDGDGRIEQAELAAYARRAGTRLAQGVSLTADGDVVALELAAARASLSPGRGGLDVLRIDAAFRGRLPEPEAELDYADSNYAGRVGWREIVASPVDGQGIASSSVPATSVSDGLRSYPKDRLASPVDVASAQVTVRPGAGDGAAAAAAEGRDRPWEPLAGAFASLVEGDVSPAFLVVALLVALGAGALHALGPGHGKTVMAAYLVGAEGRARHAVAIGVAVSVMHTASVVALGLATLWASHLWPPERVLPWLSLASGAVVLALGAWLLRSRWSALRALRAGATKPARAAAVSAVPGASQLALATAGGAGPAWPSAGPGHGHERALTDEGRARHGDDHAHGHGAHGHGQALGHDHGFGHHHHGPPAGVSPLSRRGLAAVALSGGLLPSPTALVVLLGAVALHRVALGVFLVGAFSVGLAAALVAIGLLVLRAREVAHRHLGGGVGALLPVLSAGAIVAAGIFLSARALLAL